jgi:FkbM family methyltransferase
LKRNLALNECGNVVLVEKALGDKPGTLPLFIAEENKGAHTLFPDEDMRKSKTVDVEVIRFDDYLKEHGGDPIDFIKIDAEGADGLIMEGMKETLNKNHNVRVIVEFAPEALDRSGYGAKRLVELIDSCGFEIFLIDDEHDKLTPIPAKELATHTIGLVNLFLKRKAEAK